MGFCAKLVVAAAAAVWAVAAPAQEEAAAPTFHIMADLLQVPVLVLSEAGRPLPPIAGDRFVISVAGGSTFHPMVRREGDDAIALGVLVDRSGGQGSLLGGFAREGTSLLGALHPEDSVAIDQLDHCLLRHVLPPSAPEVALSRRAVLASTELPQDVETAGRRQRCGRSVKLWDGMMMQVGALSREPGRRVLLVITDGHDEGSSTEWAALRKFAVLHAVTLFAVRDPADGWWVEQVRATRRGWRTEGDTLSEVCQLTGGVVMESSATSLRPMLQEFVAIVRNRYILEFPRPRGLQGAESLFEVRVEGMQAFVRPAGVGFPQRRVSGGEEGVETKEQPRPVAGDRVKLPSPQ